LHYLHGSRLVAKTAFAVATISFVSSIYYKIEAQLLQGTIFFCATYLGSCYLITLWVERRETLQHISKNLIITAEAIEARANPKQLARMMGIAKVARLVAAVYYTDIALVCFLFEFLPVFQGRLAAAMPLLPETRYSFWMMYSVEASVILCGLVSSVTFLVYYIEVCLCLAILFSVLSEHFKTLSANKCNANAFIEIHQKLLESSREVRNVFSFTWFVSLLLMILMLVVSTYSLIMSNINPVMCPVVIVTCLVILLTPCVLGELVSSGSERVAWGVYCSGWIETQYDVRQALLVTLLRSQRPACMVGGLLGKLVLSKYLDLLKEWYRLVQFLLSLK